MPKLISNFSGGVNASVNPLLLKENQLKKAINYKLDTVGSLTKRNGYSVFASQPVAGKPILGLAQYTNTTTATETTQVMVANNAGNTNAVIYYNLGGTTWVASKLNDMAVVVPSNLNRSRFVTFLDYLFRVNGQNVVATSNDVNGATWGTTNAPTVITPTFISVFQDRVYVARNGTSYASRVYYSSIPTAGAITWTTADDWFDVNPDDGDEITALENCGDKLLIFKNRALYRWDFGYTEPDRLIGVGTASQESVKTSFDLGITFFANSKGVFAYNGKRPRLISRKIQPWIDAVTSWGNVCAEVDDDHYYLYLGDSLTVQDSPIKGSSTYTNVMAVYSISLDAWTIYLLNTPWRVANKLIWAGVEKIYFGNTQGRTYKWDTGLADYSGGTSYNSAVNISAEAVKEVFLSYPLIQSITKVGAVSNGALQTTLSYMTNNDVDFIPCGNLFDRYMLSGNIGKEANSVELKVSDNARIASRIDALYVEFESTEKEV
jgi:hypothetical protein